MKKLKWSETSFFKHQQPKQHKDVCYHDQKKQIDQNIKAVRRRFWDEYGLKQLIENPSNAKILCSAKQRRQLKKMNENEKREFWKKYRG